MVTPLHMLEAGFGHQATERQNKNFKLGTASFIYYTDFIIEEAKLMTGLSLKVHLYEVALYSKTVIKDDDSTNRSRKKYLRPMRVHF